MRGFPQFLFLTTAREGSHFVSPCLPLLDLYHRRRRSPTAAPAYLLTLKPAPSAVVFPALLRSFLPGANKVVALLVRAWVLDRLEWVQDRGWTVLPATGGETPVALGQGPALAPQSAYRLSIDLVSSTNCFVRAKGPAGLRERIGEFAKEMSNGSEVFGLKRLPNASLLSNAVRSLHAEADWWEHNTHPASNGWQSARAAR